MDEADLPNDNINEIPEHHRIDDLEGWLRRNGLQSASQDAPLSELRNDEARARLQEHSQYENSILQAIFEEAEKEEARKQQERQKRLESWTDVKISISTSDQTEDIVSDLRPLAESCDTVFALASSWDHFSRKDQKVQLSLDRFQASSIQEFLELVESISVSPNTVEECTSNVSPEAIVDCCQIAHYLQNSTILEATVDILIESIDTANCLSLCQLADQLNLSTLFERSLAHMMQSLGDLEENDAWDHFSPELQSRIAMIQTAIHSSVHSQRTKLFFGSLEEYLAIFAETVQYHRERLAEAQEQQQQMKSRGPAWLDAQTKIDRQEVRVNTLEAAWKEQKKLFSKRQE